MSIQYSALTELAEQGRPCYALVELDSSVKGVLPKFNKGMSSATEAGGIFT